MHSDAARGPGPLRRGLQSQGLGVCCGLATTLLLAIGSVVLTATRATTSAGVQLDDFRAFFSPLAPTHLWFYALIPVLALYALNTVLATWDSVVTRWRAGWRDPRAYAAAVIHLAFLAALMAHLLGGLYSRDGGALVHRDWTELPDGREIRLTSIEQHSLPNGMPRAVDARVELRDGDGGIRSEVLGYNRPLSRGLGTDLVLLQRPVSHTVGVRLLSAGEDCVLSPGAACRLAGRSVVLRNLQNTGAHGMLAEVVVGGRATWLMQGRPDRIDEGPSVVLADIQKESAVAVRLRHAPGNPWALVAAIMLVAGVLLMARRFF